ncbi:hypothetical protein QLX08_002911 [Tetragonisca angustula]|uniref:Uncharacterized protein n=1 Tax=Tetragonisca angustula TaxID=166442 RepID=A0AAW1A9C6_9HYME
MVTNIGILLLLVLQKTDNREIFHIPYYKKITRYIQLLEQDPYHKTSTRHVIVIIVAISISSIIFPSTIEIYASLRKNDIDEVIECLPQFVASTISVVKILNIHFNRQSFNKLLQLITKQWKQLELNGELHVLEEIVMQGNKMAQFYNTTLVTFDTLLAGSANFSHSGYRPSLK